MPRDTPNQEGEGPLLWKLNMEEWKWSLPIVTGRYLWRSYWLLEQWSPWNWSFPQQSHAGRRKMREPGTSQGRNLSFIKGPHTVLTFQTEGYWTQDNDGSVVGRTTLWPGLLSYTSVSLFKSKPHSRTLKMNLGVSLDPLISCSCHHDHVEWMSLFWLLVIC